MWKKINVKKIFYAILDMIIQKYCRWAVYYNDNKFTRRIRGQVKKLCVR